MKNASSDFFKAFWEGAYKFNFQIKYPVHQSKAQTNKNLHIFKLLITIKHKGIIIWRCKRENWTWLRKDPFIPLEAYDLIPVLQKLTSEIKSPELITLYRENFFPKGNYEVAMQMAPAENGCKMPSTQYFFIVNGLLQ